MISIDYMIPSDLPRSILEQAVQAVLDSSGNPDSDLTIVLMDDLQIQSLNREFLGVDAPTDVISFPADEPDPETGRQYLGDVVISLPRAADQAAERGHNLHAEVQLLVIHGILHLLGHDHAGKDEKKHMWAAQRAALEKIGISPGIIHG